jgi:uncharacterized membrane-anchored protein YitT (DUF2179 family)
MLRAPMRSEPIEPVPHSALEDALAILTATAFVSLGTGLLKHLGLLTGGSAGIALLLSRLTPFTFGQIFLTVNVPFFWLGVRQMGWRFTGKTFASIALVSVATDQLHRVLRFGDVQPAYGAVIGGLLVGMGLLILFRHQACLGGLNIVSIWLQRRRAVRAGAFQMAVDSLIVAASFLAVTPATLALSVLGAVAMNLVLAVNHRPGRYLGT